MRNGNTIYRGINNGIRWKPLAVWGGGYITGMDKVGDTHVARSDTAGSWIWDVDAAEWVRFIRLGDNVAEADGKYNYATPSEVANGCYEIVIAPSDENIIYAWEMGYVYRSDDKGATVSKTGLPQVLLLSPNDNSRTSRRKMIVDSASADVVGLFNPTVSTGGFFYTLNGGTSFTQNATVPPSTTGTGGCVAYDRDSSTSGTPSRHSRWACYVPGEGLSVSTTGPNGTFTEDTGYPGGDITSMVMFGNGVIIACDAASIYRRTAAGVWSTVSTDNAVSLSVNYADTTKVLAVSDGGALLASTDSGQTWTTDVGTGTRTAPDAPWLATTDEAYMSAGMILHDPAVAGRVWFGEGIGMWYADSVSYVQGVKPSWISRTKGIRNLVTQYVNMMPDGTLLLTCQDRNTARIPRALYDTAPSQVGFDNADSIRHGNDRDYALDDPDYQVLSVYTENPIKIATDGGGTATSWTAAALGPDGNSALGGNVAVGNAGNIVVLPAGNYPPIYSLDGGDSWDYCLFDGVPLPTLNGNGGTANGLKPFNSLYLRRKVLIRDPNNAGHFWVYVCSTDDLTGNGPTLNATYAGLWRSMNGGASFTQVYGTNLDPSGFDFWHSHLVAVPGKDGHLFWCCGDVGLDDHAANVLIKFSPDYGETWATVPGMYECEAMCVGPAAPGRTYPTLTAYGYTAVGDASTRIVGQCVDFDPTDPSTATWDSLGSGPFPRGDYCSGVTLASHPDCGEFGLFVMGKAGAGALYGRYDHTAHGT